MLTRVGEVNRAASAGPRQAEARSQPACGHPVWPATGQVAHQLDRR